MWSFLKRQLKTKTGRFGAALVVGTVANQIGGDPETSSRILGFANHVFSPESGVLGLAAMFLRDRAAKSEYGGR